MLLPASKILISKRAIPTIISLFFIVISENALAQLRPFYQDIIPYAELVGLRLEDGIKADQKEAYLSNDEFTQVFNAFA
jgi:hypothetical protein